MLRFWIGPSNAHDHPRHVADWHRPDCTHRHDLRTCRSESASSAALGSPQPPPQRPGGYRMAAPRCVSARCDARPVRYRWLALDTAAADHKLGGELTVRIPRPILSLLMRRTLRKLRCDVRTLARQSRQVRILARSVPGDHPRPDRRRCVHCAVLRARAQSDRKNQDRDPAGSSSKVGHDYTLADCWRRAKSRTANKSFAMRASRRSTSSTEADGKMEAALMQGADADG